MVLPLTPERGTVSRGDGMPTTFNAQAIQNVVASLAGNTFQRRRCARQTKPLQECHPERSEGSRAGQRSFALLRMTKRDGLFFEMYCPLRVPGAGCQADRSCQDN